ncbi:MAG: bifunctional diguanylate cyclase/phosphodiesterase [Colwellia sp.]|nr:bifunctional diguanylate cyclase/phosphodiesterase [Colwellia sp.]
MSGDVETISLDTDLRRHLLYGSIGLAIVVLIVFIIVTYRLSSDLGESIESAYIKNHVEKIAELVKDIPNSEKLATLEKHQSLQAYFTEYSYYIDQDVVSFHLWFTGEIFKIKNDKRFDHNPDIAMAISKKTSNDGVIKINGERYFWIYQYPTKGDGELLLIRKVYALDQAIEYMYTRLSISAFLTFWLAIWSALLISSLITKKFIERNVRLNYLASHDTLTQLPNRSSLHDMVSRYLKPIHSTEPTTNTKVNKASILLIDLNKFKEVNDTMGHQVGDTLLKSIAVRLNLFVDENTHVFRYGGDEFVIWQEKSEQTIAIKLAEKIIKNFRQPVLVDGSKFEMSSSIGIACYPEDGLTFNELFKHADIAMYHAKRLRLGYQHYQQRLDLRSDLRVNLRGQLNHALTQDQFVLHFQPKVSLMDGEIFGVEALVRWQHPVEGLLAPGMFINIIEQSEIVHEFTRYVFKQAIAQCKSWMQQDIKLSVAVNISPYNLMDPQLVPFLQEQLDFYQVPAELLEVELTESATMVGIETTKKVFNALKKMGVKLSIDDFGTGMSSLAYIKQLNVDYIKVDRSFITNIATDTRDEAIIMSILLLCQKLNREVIIEGVETKEQKEKIIALGCKFAQGYYFGKPVPADILTTQLVSL